MTLMRFFKHCKLCNIFSSPKLDTYGIQSSFPTSHPFNELFYLTSYHIKTKPHSLLETIYMLIQIRYVQKAKALHLPPSTWRTLMDIAVLITRPCGQVQFELLYVKSVKYLARKLRGRGCPSLRLISPRNLLKKRILPHRLL